MEPEKIYIISDIHLNLLKPKKRKLLLKFFEQIVSRQATGLYLNGDIIDFMEPSMSEDARDDIRSFAHILHGLAQNGIPIQYVLGNHDLPLLFLFPSFRAETLEFVDVHSEREPVEVFPNFTLHYRSTDIVFEDKQIYMEHGHIYDLGWVPGRNWNRAWENASSILFTDDWVENIFNLWEIFKQSGEDYDVRILRTGSHLPPAEYVRREGSRLAINSNYDWVILSHFHAPTLEELGNGLIFANPGDSLQHGSYIALVDQEIRVGDWRETLGAG
jgi:UDP-2,3-diacylglucosamine pyrophosphatase LpxH